MLGLLLVLACCGSHTHAQPNPIAPPPARPGPPAPGLPQDGAPANVAPVEPLVWAAAARPASLTQSSAADILANLEAPDQAARDDAFTKLLQLAPADLPLLLDAVRAAPPASPGGLELLRSAVEHVHLASLPYPVETNRGFLGISLEQVVHLNDTPQVSPPPPDAPPDAPPGPPPGPPPGTATTGPIGILITSTTPGLPSFQYLRVGDVIVGVENVGTFTEASDFSKALAGCSAGDQIQLQIIRDGRRQSVKAALAARPAMADLAALDSFRAEREPLARDYWDQNWLPALSRRPATAPAK
jgi:hypothetical protein